MKPEDVSRPQNTVHVGKQTDDSPLAMYINNLDEF